jgi:hypothetical protein
MLKLVSKIDSGELYTKIIDCIKEGKFPNFLVDGDGDISHKGYEYDSDSSGAEYKYKDDYYCKAWLRVKLDTLNNELCFGIIGRNDTKMTKHIYAWYFTQLAELLLDYFDTDIETITITSNKIEDVDKF